MPDEVAISPIDPQEAERNAVDAAEQLRAAEATAETALANHNSAQAALETRRAQYQEAEEVLRVSKEHAEAVKVGEDNVTPADEQPSVDEPAVSTEDFAPQADAPVPPQDAPQNVTEAPPANDEPAVPAGEGAQSDVYADPSTAPESPSEESVDAANAVSQSADNEAYADAIEDATAAYRESHPDEPDTPSV